MKKTLLTIAISLIASYAFSQTTIGVSGQNLIVNQGTTSVGDQLTLNVNGTNSIGNVESVNMLLATGSPGGSNGSSFFGISGITPTSPFTLANNGAASAFNTAGDAANTGTTVSNPSTDVGSNAPAGSAPTVNGTGATSIPFETVNFSLAPNTPVGTYSFRITLGGLNDAQGSWIDNTSNATFDVNSAPTFTITVVPEPATWSLIALGGLSVLGANMMRLRGRS